MKTLGVIIIKISFLIITTNALSHPCTPGPDEIALFQDDYFGGVCKILKGGDHTDENVIGLPDNSISSIKVGINAIAKLCTKAFYEGTCEYINYNDESLSDNDIGNDSVSSIRVFSGSFKCNPAPDEVALFMDDGYKGVCKILKEGPYLFELGYGLGFGLPDNSISSIKVGSNAIAKLCTKAFYEGACEYINYNDESLSDNNIGNDRMSSIRVFSGSPNCNPAPDEVAIFMDDGYKGICKILKENLYPNEFYYGLPYNSISSIKVGSNAIAKLCNDISFNGTCEYINCNDESLSDNNIGNNRMSSIQVISSSPNCNPAPDEVALFMDDDYKGICKILKESSYLNKHNIGLPYNSISSIKVGSNAIAKLCNDSSFNGTCEYINYNDESLSDNDIGNDRLSSIYVFTGSLNCTPKSDEIALFTDDTYKGFCKILKKGYYVNEYGFGVPDNSVSSIKVGSNAIARLCKNRNMEHCKDFYHSGNSLSDSDIGNDNLSSIQVLSGASHCEPAANEVALFLHSQYGGYCTILKKGFYFDADDMNFGDNQLTSVKVGSNAALVLYDKVNFRGKRELLLYSDADLSDNYIENDKVSSMAVFISEQDCIPKENQVTVYIDSDYAEFCSTLDYGIYRHTAHINLPNDTISSIRVGAKAEAILCEDMDFMGNCVRFIDDDTTLVDNNLNDKVSSLIVWNRNSSDIAKKWWNINLGPIRKDKIRTQIKTRQKIVIILWDPVRLAHPRKSASEIYNAFCGLQNSMNGYYRENSSALFKIEIVGFYGWISPEPRKRGNFYWDYNDPDDSLDKDGFRTGHSMRWRDAVRALDEQFHFSEELNTDKKPDFDNNQVLFSNEIGVVVVTPQNSAAGFRRNLVGSQTIGKKKETPFITDNGFIIADVLEIFPGSSLPVGIFAHEVSHLSLGLGDMYWGKGSDEWYNPYTARKYSMMASGIDNKSHLDPVLKLKLGWAVPHAILTSGEYILTDVESTNRVWVIFDPNHGFNEYFVLENRWPGKSYETLLDSGIAIWHVIDDDSVNFNQPKPTCTPIYRWNLWNALPPEKKNWERRAIRLIRSGGLRHTVCDEDRPLADDKDAMWRSGSSKVLHWADSTSSGITVKVLSSPGKKMIVKVSFP